jgi:spore coat polysaccharide biosynthesis predicted glycosyltransferase SpsG
MILASLDAVSAEFAVDVVIGPFNVHQLEVEEAARACARPVQLLSRQQSLMALMSAADMSISAAGQTLYELAATGTPTVAIQVADNQAPNIAGFSKQGCIDSVLTESRSQIGRVVQEKVEALISDSARRLAMRTAGQRLVDGQGARRVARAIDQLL